MDFLKDLVDRFKEPSSWAGIAAILVGVFPVTAGYISYGVAIAAGVAGILSVVIAERSA